MAHETVRQAGRRPAADAVLGVLGASPWFSRLPAELKRSLVSQGELRQVTSGRWLYGSGDAPRGLFAVLHGAALAYVALPGGEEALVHVALPGEIFGHAARLGQGPRLATVLAAQRSDFLYLSETALEAVARRHPDLWQHLTRLLYEQLGATLVLLGQCLVLTPRQRLALRLIQLAGRDTAQGGRIQLRQAQIGELVGVSRKTASGLLREFADAGYLKLGYRGVEILDRAALGRIGNGS